MSALVSRHKLHTPLALMMMHRAWMPNHTCFADSNYWRGGSNSARQGYGALADFKGVCSVADGPPACK